MGYTGHTVTRPRSILVIIGGLLAWAGMVGGVLLTTPQYHLSLTMKEEPVEMTWHQLVEQGLTDNTHVRLLDVALEKNEPSGFFEEMLNFDPESTVEDQQAVFEEFAPEMDFSQVLDEVTRPLKVYPQGEDADLFPASIVVPNNGWAAELAAEEIEATGTLTGRFTISDGTDFSTQIAKSLLSATQAMEQSADGGAAASDNDADLGEDATLVVTSDEDPSERLSAPGLGGQEAEIGTTYVFEPSGSLISASEAGQWFWLSGLAAAVGLVLCGAGGPSIACCVFFQVPSILSIFGYPMRYGRATKTTRITYAALGVGLIIYGYKTMIVEARFGQPDGDLIMSALGFIPTFFGAAALLGAVSNVVVNRFNISLEPQANKKKYEPPISLSAACSLEPIESDRAIPFQDRHLTATDQSLPEELNSIAFSLASVGFESAEHMTYVEGLEPTSVLIQLGCQDMVVADIERVEGVLQSRLISVLHDGMTVITLSKNYPVGQEMRFGTSGQYLRSRSSDPIDMLSAHLEQAVTMAEKRDTSVITIDPSETVDVAEFGRRVFAHIRAQYGEENVEVEPALYGRFQFPPQPIPAYESV
jgi:hypothetical protein